MKKKTPQEITDILGNYVKDINELLGTKEGDVACLISYVNIASNVGTTAIHGSVGNIGNILYNIAKKSPKFEYAIMSVASVLLQDKATINPPTPHN